MNNLIAACVTLSEPSDKYAVVLDDYFEKKCLTYSVLHKFREDVSTTSIFRSLAVSGVLHCI